MRGVAIFEDLPGENGIGGSPVRWYLEEVFGCGRYYIVLRCGCIRVLSEISI